MQKLSLIIIMVMVSVCTKAQDNSLSTDPQNIPDFVKAAGAEQAALLFPRIRQFTITHEENGVGKITSKLNGNDVFEGDFRSSRTRINFNLPVLQRKNNTLVASLGVIHQFYELSNVKSMDPQNPVYDDKMYIPMVSTGLTYIRTEKLFGKPVTFTVSGGGLFNPSMDRSQFTFTGIATVPLIQKENTRLTAGAVVLIDPASPVPFFLMVNYFHKFKEWDMDLMIDLPYRLALRKEMTPKTSLTFFNELGGSNSFFDFTNPIPSIPTQKLTLSSLEIKSGLMAEYRLTKKAVISLSAGANYMVNSRIREGNSKPDNYFMENKHKPVPFVQVGFSLLPFWKGLNL
ncbi:MAG: DUF6268 family outer membrane beta-barrel protein [Prevotella sp.]|jgi:hypothetical protein|nr:DUF6268 family outer membrane beta-barrel protein [Prevotella sp.]